MVCESVPYEICKIDDCQTCMTRFYFFSRFLFLNLNVSMPILFFCLAERLDRIPNLGFVPAELWAKISYDFLCEAIEKHQPERAPLHPDNWDAANLSFNLFSMTPNPAPKPVKVNLKRLCTWYLAQKAVGTAMELILYFLVSGSDHTALSFYEGDTYIHGAIFVTILSGEVICKWVQRECLNVYQIFVNFVMK